MAGRFKYRILLVDHDEELLQKTADVLTREGYLVHIARDGFEALTVLRGGHPEILISDLNIPNMSGFELLAVVRKRFPGIGVIAASRRTINQSQAIIGKTKKTIEKPDPPNKSEKP